MIKRGMVSFFIIMISSILLSSCSEKPSPHDALQKYTKLWTNQQFEDMYAMLSKQAKQNISKENFINRYKKIYKDIKVTIYR
jgi:penicillin-binding protein 3